MKANINLKELPPKKRIGYIWDYYKFWIIGGIFLLSTLFSSVYRHFTAKDCLLKLIMVNGVVSTAEPIVAEDYLTARGYDTNDYEIIASSVEIKMTEESYQDDYYNTQSLIVRITSGDIDIVSAPADIFKPYQEEGYLMNLEEIFTKDELAQYDNIVYTTDLDTNITYPCAFDFSENAWMKEHRYYNGSCQFGILYNCQNTEQAKDFLLYILNY